jgi:hypothetical protein
MRFLILVFLPACAGRALPLPDAPDLAVAPDRDFAVARDLAAPPADLAALPADLAAPPADLREVAADEWQYGSSTYAGRSGAMAQNTLLAYRITVDRPREIDHLGMVIGAVGGEARMGLYHAEGNQPGDLVVTSAARPLDNGGDGVIRFDVGAISLAPGDYFLTVVFPQPTMVGIRSTPTSWRCHRALSRFADDWPARFGSASCSETNTLDLFVRMRSGPRVDGGQTIVKDAGTPSALGWPEPFAGSELLAEDWALFQPLTLDQPRRLAALGVIGAALGGNATMALYRDAGGAPGELVASSLLKTPVDGSTVFDVTDLDLAAGGYWIAVVLSAPTSLTADLDHAVRRCKHWRYHTQPWPYSFGMVTNCADGPTLNLFLNAF